MARDWTGWKCHMPRVLQPKEAGLYRKLREAHCDSDEPSHMCQGRLTIDRNGITLSCPRCGDTRALQPKDRER